MGWPHPDHLLRALTPEQFQEWCEFYALEPWGFDIEDVRHGALISYIVRALGGNRDARPTDFMMGEHGRQEVDDLEKARSLFGGGRGLDDDG